MSPSEEKRGRALLIKWKISREPIRVDLSFDGMVKFTGFGVVKGASERDALLEGKDWSLLLEFSLGHFEGTVSEEALTETPLVDPQSEATTIIFALPNDKCFLSTVLKRGGKPN
jgi:hypothetical protein